MVFAIVHVKKAKHGGVLNAEEESRGPETEDRGLDAIRLQQL